MNKNDYNEVFERMEDDMIDAGKDIVSPGTLSGTIVNMPKRAKGGTFAPADMELLKRALRYYKDMLVSTEERERNASPELMKVANLLHRIGRIA